MTPAQILAIAIFVLMLGVVTWGRVERYIPALGAAGLVLLMLAIVMDEPERILSVLNIGQLVHAGFWFPHEGSVASRGVNWQTIIYIAGMMVMVGGLAEAGFFRWVCLSVTRLVHYRASAVLVAFMLLSGLLSMFIDSTSVSLFLASVTIEIARMLKFDPVPVIVAVAFASNTGGAATMSGDPPNVIVGTSLGYTFTDFILGTGPVAWAGLLLAVLYFWLVFRRQRATAQQDSSGESETAYPQPREAIQDRPLFLLHTGVFVIVVALLVCHSYLGISVATVGVAAAVLTLLATRHDEVRILERVDWRTLLFFIGLFICVGGLEETGVQQVLAERIGRMSAGSLTYVMSIILWLSASVSAFVDNIPLAVTMVPVISGLAQLPGLTLRPMAFALVLGTDIGGNATPIGASANVVATAVSRRAGHSIGWGRYLKYAVPPTLLVLALCNVALLVRY